MRSCFALLLTTTIAHGQTADNPAESTIDTTGFPTIGEVVRHDAALDALIAPGAKIEVLADGFVWAEGPVWVADEDGGHLLFSDIPRNAIMKWKQGVGCSLFMKPAGYTGVEDYGGEPGSNGLALDSRGHLIACEHGDRRLSLLTKGGGKRTIVDNFEGKRLNSPNDVCIKSNGDLYFTDPPYGLPKRWEDPRRELDYCGVYRRATDGTLTLLTKELDRPNGIAFSPDEKTLYVAQSDSSAPIIKAFPVKADGTIGEGRVLFDFSPDYGKLPGSPDGLKVDVHGNLWATAPGGVSVISPDGKRLGRISTGQRTANCAWGGDGSVLYMTADMYLCRIQTKTKGAGW